MARLDKQEVTGLKGLAITAIVFHNFFHWIFHRTAENEIDFRASRFRYFLTDFISSPPEWIQSLSTYFGHFGVQVFMFLSASSLAVAYPDARWGSGFLTSRVRKLAPTIALSIAIWSVWSGLGRGPMGPLHVLGENARDLGLVLLGLYPLVPGHTYPMVGPWWFLSFIAQFYVIWTLISRWVRQTSDRMLLVVAAGGVFFNLTVVYLVQKLLDINLLLTPLGHLPELFLGLYCGRRGVSTSWPLWLASVAGLGLSGMYRWIWPLHHLSGLVVLLIPSVALLRRGRTWLGQGAHWLGVHSLAIFLINGFMRRPFVDLARKTSEWWMDLTMALTFFCSVCVVAFLVTRLASGIEGWAARRWPPPAYR